jgi:GNAT superfamily N-acetyltransferase
VHAGSDLLPDIRRDVADGGERPENAGVADQDIELAVALVQGGAEAVEAVELFQGADGVHDDFRQRGIGTALLAAVVEVADRWLGLKRLQLTVYADNEPAIRLYRKFGFEKEGRLRAFAFRDGVYVDALAIARLA